MHTKPIMALALALVLSTGSFAAYAAPNEAVTEAAALSTVKVSAAEAISAVEAKGTGKVVELALLQEGTTSVYHLTTLMPDGTETNYAVDAITGDVVATVDISADQGDGDGEYADDDQGTGQDRGDGDGETQDDGAN